MSGTKQKNSKNNVPILPLDVQQSNSRMSQWKWHLVSPKQKPITVTPEHPMEKETALPTDFAEREEAVLNRWEKIAISLERSRIADYAALMGRPKKLIWLNLLGGMARGVGFSIGFTVLVALLLSILNLLVGLDLPLIGDFIARLMEYVEDARSIRP